MKTTSATTLATLPLILLFSSAPFATAQTSPRQVEAILEQPIHSPLIVTFQFNQYLATKIQKPYLPATSGQWTTEAKRLRRYLLEEVAFHGWPREWVNAPPKFEDLGEISTGGGYRARKLRYEIVPGFESTAILYLPEGVRGRVPGVLNVNGHDPQGKAAEYKQKRCINFAMHGVIALSLEWVGFGELSQGENAHDFGAHLDLVGANQLGLFYLAMRRGLDYLAHHPMVDPSRLGVSGLSGGGWQTIVLGALDERVAVAVEVAGFGSLESNLARPTDTDEIEEDATDLTEGLDYPTLVAMRAPRPTLLVHNAEDSCCFRADLVRPYIFDAVRPFFRLYGREQNLAWHENLDPATHNFQLDNRAAAYRFFAEHFHLPLPWTETPSGAEIKSEDELAVGLPKANLTLLGLARKLAAGIERPRILTGAARAAWEVGVRAKLAALVRYRPVAIARAWRLANTKNKGLETISYRLDFENGLSAVGVWLKATASPEDAPATLVLNDQGKKAAGSIVSERVNRDEQVLALDLFLTGESAPVNNLTATYALKFATTGDRPLGLEVEQLLAAAHWLRAASGTGRIRLETAGIRSQVVAAVAAGLQPEAFSEVVSRQAMASFGYLLDAPVPFREAPELFCLDLYREFDLDVLDALAGTTRVVRTPIEAPPKK